MAATFPISSCGSHAFAHGVSQQTRLWQKHLLLLLLFAWELKRKPLTDLCPIGAAARYAAELAVGVAVGFGAALAAGCMAEMATSPM